MMGPFGLEFKDHVAYLYRIEDLEKLVIDIRNSDNKRIDLRDFISKSIEWLAKNWEASWAGPISACIFVMNGNDRAAHSIMTGEQFFAYGMLFERMRQDMSLTVTVQVVKMTPEEMEKKVSSIEERAEDDDEG